MRTTLRGAALAAALLVTAAPVALAQETTGTIRGQVSNEAGANLPGADVVITHVPSGSVTRTRTNAGGEFNASGLRVGGPFTVTVTSPGLDPETITDLSLSAGQPLRLPVTVRSAAIVVTGTRVQRAYNLSTGPITALNAEAIKNVATVNRDIRDIVRRSPFATIDPTNSRTIEIAGQNGRLNRFSVDGVRFSDTFGLNNGGLPTNRGPVPIDVLEQVQIAVAPYDVAEGDFQGGSINAIVKTGSNAFHGSGFYTYTDDDLTGDRTKSRAVNLTFQSRNYGGYLTGPILKDKLFFTFAYEKLDEGRPIDIGGPGSPSPVPGLTDATIANVIGIAQSRYGFDAGEQFLTTSEGDEKAVGKLAWNITNGQTLTATYIYNNGSNQFQQNQSVSATSPSLGLSSNAYQLGEEVNAGVVQLNSQWNDRFSTEARVVYRDYKRGQTPFGGLGIAQFEVCTDPVNTVGGSLTQCSQGNAAAPGAARLFFGPDISRQANELRVKTWTGELVARLTLGEHAIKGYFQYQKQDVFNLFVQRATGDLQFDSLADFGAGRANRFRFGGAVGGLDPAATYNYGQFSFALQDSWTISDQLTVQLGGRYDLFGSAVAPVLNPFFTNRYGFTNQETYNGRGVFQPRFGFTFKPQQRVVVRGGAGLFAGGTPDVWLSNSFSQTGIQTNQIDITRVPVSAANPTGFNVPGLNPLTQGALVTAIGRAALDNVNGRTVDPLVLNYLQTNTAALATSPVNAIDRGFNIPSVWKVSLSGDYRANLGPLGDNWNLGVDLLFTETNAAADYVDLRLTQCTGTAPDGRPRYTSFGGNPATCAGGLAGTNQDLLLLTNTKGRAYVAVARFDKRFAFGLNVAGSYTFSDVRDRNGTTSATAGSQYANNQFVDPNRAAYGRSIYEIRDQFKFEVGYSHAFYKDYKSRVSFFGEHRSGRPYSLTLNDPTTSGGRSAVFGTVGSGSRYLAYVPNVSAIGADPRVVYDNAATFNALQAFVQSRGLKQGEITGKNTERSPSFFKIDLHVDQEIPAFVGPSRIRLFADVENFGNLLNKNWGQLRQVQFPQNAPIVNVACVASGANPCAQYRYSNFQNPNVVVQTLPSLWQLRIGARVEF